MITKLNLSYEAWFEFKKNIFCVYLCLCRRGTNTKEYLLDNEIGTGSVYTMQRLIRVRINRLLGIGASSNRLRKIYIIIGGLIFLFLTYRYFLTDAELVCEFTYII